MKVPYYIIATKNVDTRQKDFQMPSSDELRFYSYLHINDVRVSALAFLNNEVIPDIISHDWTKIYYLDKFHFAMQQMVDGKTFKHQEWWQIHKKYEPHHAFDYCGVRDIHLGHLIHMIADWHCAAVARGDGVIEPKDDIEMAKLLKLAFDNTVKWFTNNIKKFPDLVLETTGDDKNE